MNPNILDKIKKAVNRMYLVNGPEGSHIKSSLVIADNPRSAKANIYEFNKSVNPDAAGNYHKEYTVGEYYGPYTITEQNLLMGASGRRNGASQAMRKKTFYTPEVSYGFDRVDALYNEELKNK